MRFHRDIAELATKKDTPSPRKQFQCGWKQAEDYFARHHFRFEDVTEVVFAIFLGRQFFDLVL